MNAGRIAAGLVALAPWAGLAVQFEASLGLTGDAVAALWAMLRYFTVLTNLAVALIFTGIAFGGPRAGRPFVVGGVTLAILLVGIVYALLLQGLLSLSGGAALADLLMHKVTPVLVALWWLAFAAKGGLTRRDPWLWMLYPLGYFAYALARAVADGVYPYPFIDASSLGWPRTGLNALLVAVSFVLGGYALVAIDRRLARRGQAATRSGRAFRSH